VEKRLTNLSAEFAILAILTIIAAKRKRKIRSPLKAIQAALLEIKLFDSKLLFFFLNYNFSS